MDEHEWLEEIQESFDLECSFQSESSCRTLYAAVLERAFRDVIDSDKTITPEEKDDALDWFLSRGLDWDGISFDDCILALDLTSDKVKFLNKKVLDAIENDKQ